MILMLKFDWLKDVTIYHFKKKKISRNYYVFADQSIQQKQKQRSEPSKSYNFMWQKH